jgi:hypothetical protein
MGRLVKYFLYACAFYIGLNIIDSLNLLNGVKDRVPSNYQYKINKYIFPYKKISALQEKIVQERAIIEQQSETIEQQSETKLSQALTDSNITLKAKSKLFNQLLEMIDLHSIELAFNKSGKTIKTELLPDIAVPYDGLILHRHQLIGGFYSGIAREYPGSGYIDFAGDRMILLSS